MKKSSNFAYMILIGCIAFFPWLMITCNTNGNFTTAIMDETGWSRTIATMYLTVFPVAAACFQPLAGWLLNKYSRRNLLTMAVTLYCAGYILTSQFTALWQWICYGILYGFCAAFFMYVGVPLLVNVWFKKNNGFWIGLVSAGTSILVTIFSPIITNWILVYGWRTARLYIGLLELLAIPVTFLCIRQSPESMGLKPWGADDKTEKSGTDAQTELTGATLSQAWKNPAMYMLLLIAGTFVLGASFIQQISSFASVGALGAVVGGVGVSVVSFSSMPGKLGLGWLSDRIGARITGMMSCIGGAVGLLLALMSGSSATMFYVGMALFGFFGFASLTVISPQITRQAFGLKNYSSIYSIITTSIFAFSAVASLMYGVVYDTTGSYTACLIVAIVFYVIGAILIPISVPIGRRSWNADSKAIN